MLKSLPSIFTLLLLLTFAPTVQAQQCLDVRVFSSECQPVALGDSITFVFEVVPINPDQNGGQWVTPGGESGSYNQTSTISVVTEFTQIINVTFSDSQDPNCMGFINVANPCFDTCPIDFGITSVTAANCGSADGSAEFAVDNVSPPYVIQIIDNNGNTVAQVTDMNTLTGLPSGNFVAVLYDATDLCQETLTINIPSNSDLDVTVSSSPGPNGTTWTANVTGGVPPYTYDWANGQSTSATFITAQPGVYTLVVTDANGCQSTVSFINELFECFRGTVDSISPYCGLDNGSITLIPQNEPNNYTYNWSTGATTASIDGLEAGTYTVEISDGELCTTTKTYTLTDGDSRGQTIFGTIFNPCAVLPGMATVVAVNDELAAAMSVSWADANGMVLTTENNFYPETGGDYTVSVSFNGFPACDYQETHTWTSPDFQANVIDSFGCDGLFYYFTIHGDWVAAEVTVPSGETIITQFLGANQYGPGWYYATPLNDICEGQGIELFDSFYIAPEAIICQAVNGYVYLDDNLDCELQDNEQRISSQLVRLTNNLDGSESFAYSNEDGFWDIHVPEGTYTAEVILTNTLFENCLPLQTFTIAIPVSGDPVTVNLGIQPSEFACPQLTVDLTVPLMRRCFYNPIWVSYNNTGTTVAADAQIIVEVGDWADEITQGVGGLPFDSIVAGQTPGDPSLVYFNVGNVLPFESGQVMFFVRTCNDETPLGAAACIRATGLPNNACPPADDAWSGASLAVRGFCDGNQASFRIRNVGVNDMMAPLNYVITEDAVMLNPQQLPALNSGQEVTVSEAATGSTYHILIDQVANHPGLTMPTTFVEGCASGQGQDISYGFALQIPPNDDAFWVDEDCFIVIGSYDPNDKLAEPRGYDEDHFIEPETPLEYTIRFQNTGTDTAFTVVIRDTLSELLDMSTIEIGAASHRFNVDIDTTGAINFFFPDIMLPDSFANEPLSHGAVSFRISPKAGLEPGTRIENRAGIFFDFNEPIITNTYFNTIERDFIQTGLFEFNATAANLKIYPNPTGGPAWIELPEAAEQQNLSVVVTDMLGREQLRYNYGATDRPSLDLGGLARGWYAIQLLSEGQLLGTGRVLLE